MKTLRLMFCKILPVCSHARTLRPTTIKVVLIVLVVTGLAVGAGLSIFRPFPNDDGKVQSAPATALGLPDLNESNVFFQTNFGGSVGNGQSCATCHRPADGMTVHVTTIQNAFESSGGTDPLFRFNDTANDPNSTKNTGSIDERREAYSLTLALGVSRIGRVLPAPPPSGTAEFVVATQATEKFGTLPCDPTLALDNPLRCVDPQQRLAKTLSLFRRPLVQTNMRFDSAVLWDGRADIRNIRGQVKGAATTLLLTLTPSDAAADEAAHSQLGIFTDQVIDDRSSFPESFAGNLSAQHANGGVQNLVDFAFDPTGPCVYTAPSAALGRGRERTLTLTPTDPTYFPSDGTGSLTPSSCINVTPGAPNMTTFQAWLHIPVDDGDITNLSRRRIAHGEEIFNNAVLNVDVNDPNDEIRRDNEALAAQLGTTTARCTSCHATNNIGNHPEASFFARIGSDSVSILRELADRDHLLDNFVTRTAMLPQYCLRSTKKIGATGAPPLLPAAGGVDCGSYNGTPSSCDPVTSSTCIPGDVITSDPGRAMTTGKWADIGRFKPPILRGLATRSPYFHGSAADSTVSIVDFYNTRFNIGLSQEEKNDLVRFLEAH